MTDNDELQANARRHLWMHFSQLGQFRDHEIPLIMRGEGCYVWDQHGDRKLDALSGLFTVQVGHGRKRLARAAAAQAETMAYWPIWSLRAPARDRARHEARRALGGRPEPRVLHDRRLGSRRVGVEARTPVLPRDRPAPALQGDRAPHRVPRHDDGCARAHGRLELPHAVRTAHARRCARRQHELVPPSAGEGRARVHDADDRRDRGGDPLRRTGDGRGGDPRADAERGRMPRSAGRLLPARPRDLRSLRRAAHLRRGDLRLRAARHDVRFPALRLRARHPHEREGTDERLLTARRGVVSRLPRRAVPRTRTELVRARPHVRRPPGELRGRCREPGDLRGGGRPRQRRARTKPASTSGSRVCTTSRSSATSAGPATSGPSSSSPTSRPTPGSTARSARNCCGASSRPRRTRRGSICRTDDRGDFVVQLSPPLVASDTELDEIESTLRRVLTEAAAKVAV